MVKVDLLLCRDFGVGECDVFMSTGLKEKLQLVQCLP